MVSSRQHTPHSQPVLLWCFQGSTDHTVNQCCCGVFKAAQTTQSTSVAVVSSRQHRPHSQPVLLRCLQGTTHHSHHTVNQCCCGVFRAAQTTQTTQSTSVDVVFSGQHRLVYRVVCAALKTPQQHSFNNIFSPPPSPPHLQNQEQ